MPLAMAARRRATSLAALAATLVFVLGACSSGPPTAAPSAVPTLPPATQPAAATEAPSAAQVTEAPAPALNGRRISFENGDLALGGMLWKPAGNGPFPSILWNHGSELGPGVAGSNPLLGPVFAAEGYVFFMPFRRGQGTSEGTWIVDATNAAAPADQPALIAQLHATEQLSDQLAGLAFLRNLAYVDGARIAVAGWSYGGIQTVLGAGESAGYRAAVAFTPASQAWAGNTDLQSTMMEAATGAEIPFLFIQADNDYSLVPTQELTDAIEAAGGTATRSIYPAFGTTNQDGHEFAVRGSADWGAEVFAFLTAAFGG
ncbi:MAG TPA: prolyl oligopeptidase family serine peptidase [Candidatus Limnocylindria bacterium]|nr:prolyl oligopeptidase family serine peptidase [Candidatus Limnocylindria bacterium]